MSHHHHGDHHHHHHHASDTAEPLTFSDRMIRILEHWKQHNTDHAQTYREWAKKAADAGMPDVAATLDRVAGMTLEINDQFDAALSKIPTVV